jgi:hypothetical protein
LACWDKRKRPISYGYVHSDSLFKWISKLENLKELKLENSEFTVSLESAQIQFPNGLESLSIANSKFFYETFIADAISSCKCLRELRLNFDQISTLQINLPRYYLDKLVLKVEMINLIRFSMFKQNKMVIWESSKERIALNMHRNIDTFDSSCISQDSKQFDFWIPPQEGKIVEFSMMECSMEKLKKIAPSVEK